jgi:hypothetical protein
MVGIPQLREAVHPTFGAPGSRAYQIWSYKIDK